MEPNVDEIITVESPATAVFDPETGCRHPAETAKKDWNKIKNGFYWVLPSSARIHLATENCAPDVVAGFDGSLSIRGVEKLCGISRRQAVLCGAPPAVFS